MDIVDKLNNRLDKAEIDKGIDQKWDDYRNYHSKDGFDLDKLVELNILQDKARESKDDVQLFDNIIRLIHKAGSITGNKRISLEADAYILSENTNTFYRYELNESDILNNPYSHLPKEATDILLNGEIFKIDDKTILFPMIGQPYLKERIGFPQNDAIVVGALLLKSPEILNETYGQKLTNRVGSAYHHYVNNQHSTKLGEQFEIIYGTTSHDLREPAIIIGSLLKSQSRRNKKLQKSQDETQEAIIRLKKMIEEGAESDQITKHIDDIVLKELNRQKELSSDMEFQNQKAQRKERALENNLSDYLLSIQLIGKNKVELNNTFFNIYDLIFKEVYEEFEDKAKSKSIQLDMTLKGIPHDIEVYGDQMKLKSVVRNLVSNAIKYGVKNGKVALGYERGEKHKFIVWDSGPDIPQEERHKLFGKWQRLDTEQTKKVPGTGFGLYSAKYIVEAHGGNIWYEYRGFEEKGPAFIFSLPIKSK